MTCGGIDQFNTAVKAINRANERLKYLDQASEDGGGAVNRAAYTNGMFYICVQQQLALKALLEAVRPLIPGKAKI